METNISLHRSSRLPSDLTLLTSELDRVLHSSYPPPEEGDPCTPYWGEVPWWRELETRFVISLFLLVVAVLPFMIVIWLLFASCFYIWYGAETHRRERIEMRRRKVQ